MEEKELVKQLAGKCKAKEEEAKEFVDAFKDVLTELFNKEDKVTIAELGTFEILPDKTIQFSPSSKLKQQVA